MNNDKFKVGTGNKGSKQVDFFYCDKVTVEELLQMLDREFSGVPKKDIKILPGYASCTVTTGNDFEVKQL